jgi:F420-dependent oxidoreductase-like protein
MLLSAKLAPTFTYAQLEDFWRAADELGFHAVWNYDHFYGLGAEREQHAAPTLEGWTTLAAMAKVVTRARIGCMVSAVTFRNPAVLANMAATVDHISGGRLEFGIGAAWHEAEHAAYGIDFPSPGTRVAMLREAIEITKALWTEPSATYEGAHFRITDALCEPKPLQRPHPPIVIGGTKPKMLDLIAEHADEWNCVATTPADWAERNATVDAACARLGRDPATLRRSVQVFIHPALEGQPDEVAATLPRFADAGCEHAVLSFYQPPDRTLLERMAPA